MKLTISPPVTGLRTLSTLVILLMMSPFLVSCDSQPEKSDAVLTEQPAAVHSVARQWNEALLAAIRIDLARPTVHSRNLFHTSIAMYDAWAVFDDQASPYLLGNTVGAFNCPLKAIDMPANTEQARQEAISHAVYRLLRHRFYAAPNAGASMIEFDALFARLGYDKTNKSTDYSDGSPAALGNYIAQCVIDYGLQDGANEQNNYRHVNYQPHNPALDPLSPGNSSIVNINNWQPLLLEEFVDQSGNPSIEGVTEFVGPEWGRVQPFALTTADRTTYQRHGHDYPVYKDPGAPPLLGGTLSEEYQWGFAMVSIWSSHLDPADGVMWDISPGAFGNADEMPQKLVYLRDYYNVLDGGDPGVGHTINPATNKPYAPNMVLRGDYTRVLAEFWADGPDSETPPGHWYTIMNYVSDHPQTVKRFRGSGQVLSNLEWDVKAYFALGGAMHDSAVVAWGIKGWYDYVRPVSAIRLMADRGQSSDPTLPNYSPLGIPLTAGKVELIKKGDPLAGINDEHVGKIKLYAWRGPRFIKTPATDVAGVGWILAENWWPYQRPNFVSPPFAGYVSGHSTFSRAAAEVLTLFTGDAYFPGGMGEFVAEKNEFLVFEEGPSNDVILQWATYRDASNQTSLSRIWGGIHPPVDDMPGRILGERIGINAFTLARQYFSATR